MEAEEKDGASDECRLPDDEKSLSARVWSRLEGREETTLTAGSLTTHTVNTSTPLPTSLPAVGASAGHSHTLPGRFRLLVLIFFGRNIFLALAKSSFTQSQAVAATFRRLCLTSTSARCGLDLRRRRDDRSRLCTL